MKAWQCIFKTPVDREENFSLLYHKNPQKPDSAPISLANVGAEDDNEIVPIAHWWWYPNPNGT